MLQDIIFPLSHAHRKSQAINPTEQQELAAHFDLPIERVVVELHAIIERMKSGEVSTPTKAKSLRNLIRHQFQLHVGPKQNALEKKIALLDVNPDVRHAVFRRSKSGKAAYFQIPIEKFEEGIEIARQYASESVARGDTDFTYYVVEIKHRVGIEHGKPVDISYATGK